MIEHNRRLSGILITILNNLLVSQGSGGYAMMDTVKRGTCDLDAGYSLV
jgi:hypothetical protein